MNYKAIMSKGPDLSLSSIMLEKIMEGQAKLISFSENGKIQKIINCAHIVSIVPDYDSEEGFISEDRQLEEQKPDPEKVSNALDDLKEKRPWLKNDTL